MASGTIESYVNTVLGLAKYYRCSPDRLNHQQIQKYLLYLIRERKLAWSTVSQRVYGLKFFYHDLLNRPRESFYIPSPKLPRRLPTIWSPKQIRAFLVAAGNLRLEMMIKLAYGSGLRAKEVVGLRVADIDSGNTTIWVRQGKGRKDRAAILTPSLLTDLRNYWRTYRPVNWLFPSTLRKEGHIHPASFGKMFARLKSRTGVADRPGRIHTLRHSFATHLVAAGADVYTVQRLMGHTKLSTTMIYIHLAQSIVVSGASHLDLLSSDDFKTL